MMGSISHTLISWPQVICDSSQREEWFTCSCCPPNVLRLLGQIGGYVWTHHVNTERKSAEINVHLYISSTLEFDVAGESVQLQQESDWPWSGKVGFRLHTSLYNVTIKLRIPGWAKDFHVSNIDRFTRPQNGYIELTSDWLASNPNFTL